MNEARWTRATIAGRVDWSDGLFTLQTDAMPAPFRAGQYVSIGVDNGKRRIHRLFSIASSPEEPLEFLVVRVDGGELSPRLARLARGDRMWVGSAPEGSFVLDRVEAAGTLWMFATGAGIAPFVSMLRTETPWERYGRVVLVHGVRRLEDAAYREEIARHSANHGGKLRQVFCVTREPAPEDGISGRLTDALADNRIEEAAGVTLDEDSSQVLLCGNPDMIRAMTENLQQRGLRENLPHKPGQITTERYW